MKFSSQLLSSSELSFGTLVRHVAIYVFGLSLIGGIWSLQHSGAESFQKRDAQASMISATHTSSLSAKPLNTLSPDTWLGLEVQQTDVGIALNWAYMPSNLSHYFEIERNVNGTGFQKVGIFEAKHTAEGLQHYQWYDHASFDKNSKDVFYRVKCIQANARYSYSPRSAYRLQSDWIRLENFSQLDVHKMLFDFSHEFKEAIELRIVHQSGALYYQNTFSGQYEYRQQLNYHAWPQGQYFAYLDAQDAGRMVVFEVEE